jgi:4'-phosphopantetheinyl transferase
LGSNCNFTVSGVLYNGNLPPLPSGAAHVWLTPTAEISESQLHLWEQTLSSAEQERAHRFLFEKDRALFTIARGALRQILSHYADVTPAQWVFATTSLGRPYITNPLPSGPLHFSLSHTHGLVACLVSRTEAAGIDTEDIGRTADCAAIARHAFAEREWRALLHHSGETLRRKFYEIWTLKEAYAKARGQGLSVGFERLCFAIDDSGIEASFAPALADDPAHWHFQLSCPTPRHQLGLAIRTPTPNAPPPDLQYLTL